MIANNLANQDAVRECGGVGLVVVGMGWGRAAAQKNDGFGLADLLENNIA